MINKIKVEGYYDLQFDTKRIYVFYNGLDDKKYVETYKLIDVRKQNDRSKENKIRFELDIDSIL